ncbi:hypothetical protein D3C87_1537460 [compost metagenome]
MRLDVVRAGNKLSKDRADTSRDQVRVRQIAHPYRAVVAFRDDVHEAVAVAGLDMKLGMASRHLGKNGREVGPAERQRRGHAQAPA